MSSLKYIKIAGPRKLGTLLPKVQLGYYKQKSVNFYCYSKNDVIWKKDGQTIQINKYTKRQTNTLHEEYILALRRPRFTQTGTYSCMGTLSNGQGFYATSYLYVGSKYS